jgi:membrane protein
MAKSRANTITGWIGRLRQVLEEVPLAEFGPRPALNKLRLSAHFLYLVWRGFSGNRCPMRAAGLSYTTLLALVPLLAVVLSVSKTLLQQTSADLVPKFMDKMVAVVAPQLEFMPMGDTMAGPPAPGQAVVSSRARQEAVAQIQSFIERIHAGALGAVGSVLLIFVGIRLLMTIEQTFNDIWGIERGRSIWRKVVYYWATITLGPLLLLLAMYLTGRAEFLNLVGRLAVVPGFEKFLLRLVPFAVLWVGFALMYALMPNTHVRPGAAIAGGIVGGTLWQLNSLLSTLYVSRVVTYSKIYGVIGIVPVFLVGLYFSWLIVLFGAQVSYATQNIRAYLQQRAGERIDQWGRELIACRVMLHVCAHFLHGRKPPTVEETAEATGAPPQWLNHLIQQLGDGGLLSLVAEEESGLVPARPPESITVADVLHVVRGGTGSAGELPKEERDDQMRRLLHDLRAAETASPANLRFSDLADSDVPPSVNMS